MIRRVILYDNILLCWLLFLLIIPILLISGITGLVIWQRSHYHEKEEEDEGEDIQTHDGGEDIVESKVAIGWIEREGRY